MKYVLPAILVLAVLSDSFAQIISTGQRADSLDTTLSVQERDTLYRVDTVILRNAIPVYTGYGTDTLAISDTLLRVSITKVASLDHYFNRISIIGVGDIMLGTNYPDGRYLPPNGGRDLLAEVTPALKMADVTFGNLEGAVGDEGGNPKDCNNPQYCYFFRMPESYLALIKAAGFDLLSVANNHVSDFGYSGRQITEKILEGSGIPFSGFPSHPTAIIERKGLKIGLAAFAPHNGTLQMGDTATAGRIVRDLADSADIVIVSFHSGAEGSNHQHVPRADEVFLGHNRGNVYAFSRQMIDAGADIIFGHGPHVTRAVDLYKGRFIAYSLGNFCTYRRFNLRGPNGYAPVIRVVTDRQGQFQYADVLSVIQEAPGGPREDPGGNAWRILRELTAEDFPEAPLEFRKNRILPAPSAN